MDGKAICIADNIISPLGCTSEENYRRVKAGESALRPYDGAFFDIPEPFFASLIDDKALDWSPIGGRDLSPYTEFERRLILSVASALREVPWLSASSERVLFVVSSTKGNVGLLDSRHAKPFGAAAPSESVADALSDFRQDAIPGDLSSPTPEVDVTLALSARKVALFFGNAVTPIVVSNACISGLSAQIAAVRAIEAGRCDYAIVCGTDVQGRFIVSGFQSFKALSTEACRPFDARRCGLNLGEAAATIIYASSRVVAESLHEGVAASSGSGAPLGIDNGQGQSRVAIKGVDGNGRGGLWVARGGAVRNDANHISGPSRTGEGSFRALRSAIGDFPAKELAFVNVHGTSTAYNDEMEAIALSRAGLSAVPVTGLKGYFGHTMGAAGILETILSMRAVEEGTVLGTRGYGECGVSCPVSVSAENRNTSKRAFMKLLSGFGGCNAAMLMELRPVGEIIADPCGPCVSGDGMRDFVMTHRVCISPDGATVDGRELPTECTGAELLTELYKAYVGDWPKFFKMDPLSRLGFVASELLLREERGCDATAQAVGDAAQGHSSAGSDVGGHRAVIFFGRSGSLADDRKYQATIDSRSDYFPSPAVFVYTLPNIVTGEVAIRDKYFGETAFYALDAKDKAQMRRIVADAFQDAETASVLGGWIECPYADNFEADVFIASKQS